MSDDDKGEVLAVLKEIRDTLKAARPQGIPEAPKAPTLRVRYMRRPSWDSPVVPGDVLDVREADALSHVIFGAAVVLDPPADLNAKVARRADELLGVEEAIRAEAQVPLERWLEDTRRRQRYELLEAVLRRAAAVAA